MDYRMTPKPTFDYDPFRPIPVPENKDELKVYLNAKYASLPLISYTENPTFEEWRDKAISIIFYFYRQEKFEPIIPFLAMNYFDNSLSRITRIPVVINKQGYDLPLFSICCLTLACKMWIRNFSSKSFIDKYQELRTVKPMQFHKMEMSIIKSLDWNMRPVTSLCLTSFFQLGISQRSLIEIIIQSKNYYWMTTMDPVGFIGAAILAAHSFGNVERKKHKTEKDTMLKGLTEEDLRCSDVLIQMCKRMKIIIEGTKPDRERRDPYWIAQAGENGDRSERTEKLKYKASIASVEGKLEHSESKQMGTESSTEEAKAAGESVEQLKAKGKEDVVEMLEDEKYNDFDFELKWPVIERMSGNGFIFPRT